jgi:hypothetical protein
MVTDFGVLMDGAATKVGAPVRVAADATPVVLINSRLEDKFFIIFLCINGIWFRIVI